jgi:hypothetical protein
MKLFFGPGTDRPVTVPTDVREYLSEDKRYQYQRGRSMAEAARCWVAAGERLPASIAKATGSDEFIDAHFEYPTAVWGGGNSMTDIMVYVPNGVVAIEAKVDEPFGELVETWIFEEEQKNVRSPPHRTSVIQDYARAFQIRSPQLLHLRYQLLHRTLSAALTARERDVSLAWMIVQAFPSDVSADAHQTNRSDISKFVSLVGNAPTIEGVCVQLAWVSEKAVP